MSTTKLFVHGFPNEMDKQARIDFILGLFGEYTQVFEDKITIITDRERGGLKPFLFVEVEDESAAQTIIDELDKTGYDEVRELSISLAKPKEEGDRRNSNFRNKRQGGGSYNRYGSNSY